MKISIIGGSGFVGRYLKEKLKKNFSIKLINIRKMNIENLDEADIKKIFSSNIIINCAASLNPKNDNDLFLNEEFLNHLSKLNIKLKRVIIHLSSINVLIKDRLDNIIDKSSSILDLIDKVIDTEEKEKEKEIIKIVDQWPLSEKNNSHLISNYKIHFLFTKIDQFFSNNIIEKILLKALDFDDQNNNLKIMVFFDLG